MINITTLALVTGVAILTRPPIKRLLGRLYDYLRQKTRRHRTNILFDTNYIDLNTFYLNQFDEVPCISYIRDLDGTKALEWVEKEFSGKIAGIYQRSYYDWEEKKQQFYRTIFKLKNRMLIEIMPEYVQILYSSKNPGTSAQIVEALIQFRLADKTEEFEINIITMSSGALDLKRLDIKPVSLDLGLYYNDDFREVDAVIRERLGRENDKGIILLHGLPGTGKTTYLRHLIGNLKKKVLFVSPNVAGNLMNPEFIDLLIEHPNSVLVIEDAENIIMDRRQSTGSSVSNLLNISDGLLSDCLNVQIICTFNSGLNMVDSALMRKGRLIAKYEFGKLTPEKARRLSSHLGMAQEITQPMTLADITNSHEKDFQPEKVSVIGFRRPAELLEN